MIKFLQEHHNPVQLSGRTICLEMLRNGLHASDGTFSVTHAKKVVKMVTLLWWQNQSLRELAATAGIIAGCLSLQIFHLKKDLSSEESH
jgi:hypothetical protein